MEAPDYSDYHYSLKITLIGGHSVAKTSLMTTFSGEEFRFDYRGSNIGNSANLI